MKNYSGQVFGRWTVLGDAPRDKSSRARLLCRCECGTEKTIDSHSVRSGGSLSCGCIVKENFTGHRNPKYRHGLTESVEYETWTNMKTRCLNPRNHKFAAYGGRGITVSPAWIDSFEQFYADMGPRPDGTTLDRIDNDGNYEPGNCRWATPAEQANNRRPGSGRWGPRGKTDRSASPAST